MSPHPSQNTAHEEGTRARAALLFLCSLHLPLGAEKQAQGEQPPGSPGIPQSKVNTETPAPHCSSPASSLQERVLPGVTREGNGA